MVANRYTVRVVRTAAILLVLGAASCKNSPSPAAATLPTATPEPVATTPAPVATQKAAPKVIAPVVKATATKAAVKPMVTTAAKPPATKAPVAPAAKVYANCTAMHVDYKGGVSLPGAVNQGGATKYPPHVSKALYDANVGKDRDHDGIACEA